jgi:predicted TIM-barrel fold metal-dependent hydrolase
MIIDIHTHTFPDQLAPKALAVLTNNCEVSPHTDGTNAGLCDSMRLAGIDKSAVMPIATKPEQARSINRGAAMINRQYDNLVSFGTLHPMQDDWKDEISRLAADKVPGVKFHPDYQHFFVDDVKMFPIYQALADAGLVVLFHAGVDIGLPPPVHCTPDRLARVLDAVPGMTIVAAHMGGYDCWNDVERYLVGRDLYFDTSYSLRDLGPERMTALIKAHSTDKILFIRVIF